jgi:hypothetical protein
MQVTTEMLKAKIDGMTIGTTCLNTGILDRRAVDTEYSMRRADECYVDGRWIEMNAFVDPSRFNDSGIGKILKAYVAVMRQ